MYKNRTIVNYTGGKKNIRGKILSYFPKDYIIYIEPFGGSYSVGMLQKSEVEIYNDLEDNVYCLFKVLADPELFTEFKKKCDLTYYNESIRNEFKSNLKNKELSILDRAYYFFIINRFSLSGVGGFCMDVAVRRGMSRSISAFLSTVECLEEFHQRISRIIISKKDGIKLLKLYDRDGVFFYCDPPYIWSKRSSSMKYAVDMDKEKHQEFINTILGMKKAKILISGYKSKEYNILEENGFTCVGIHKINGHPQQFRHRSAVEDIKKIECLWFNYGVTKQ